MKKEVILITSHEDLQELFFETVLFVVNQMNAPKWIPAKEAAKLLGIKNGTLSEWRRLGRIDFTQSSEQIYLYSREWIDIHLDKNSKKALR